jgi:hypothetical protein
MRRACKIRSNIFSTWTPLEASRLVRQMRLVVAVWLAMRHVVTMAAYIFLSLAARQRLESFRLFVVDRRVPRRMIGDICTSLEFVPPDLDVTYTEKKLFDTDLPALPLSTRASTTETTINESFYSTFNSLLAKGVAQDANNDQEAVFNASILPQVLQGAATRTLLEPLDVGVLFEDPSIADLEHLWDNKGHEPRQPSKPPNQRVRLGRCARHRGDRQDPALSRASASHDRQYGHGVVLARVHRASTPQ